MSDAPRIIVVRRPITAAEVWRATAVALGALIAIAFVGTLVLSRTDWGRERVRRFVLGQLQGVVAGQVTIGRIRGNLLNGATIESFAIRDSAGQPFVAATRISARYSIWNLITRKIDLHDVVLTQPLIVLDRPTGGKWNWQRIFPPSDSSKPASVRRRGFPWIVLHDVAISDGHLLMRTPWKPDTGLEPAAQQAQIREALGGGSRNLVIRQGKGYQKVVELKELDTKLPLLRITQPGYQERLAQIATLQMVALPFRPPTAIVKDLIGTLRFNNDSVWWNDVAAALPGSRLRASGKYTFTTGDMTLAARAPKAAIADFRWVYPRFPSSGGGRLNFAMEWKGTTEEYTVTDADVQTQGARLQGDFAISVADTFAIHDTDIRFSNVNTKLIEQLVPDFEAPQRGTLGGHLAIVGGRNAMQLDGDVAFRDVAGATSRAAGRGAIGYVNGDIRMRDLRLRVNPMQVAFLKSLSPAIRDNLGPIGGTVVGNVTLNGSTEVGITVSGDVAHHDRGGTSLIAGTAGMRFGSNPLVDARLQARSVQLAEIGLFVPALGLRGTASGPFSLRGPMSNLRLATALRLSDGGTVHANGTLDLLGRTKSYDLAGGMRLVNLNSVVAKAPRTSITAAIRARGTGFAPATMNGVFAADFAASTWDSVSVDTGSVRVAIANGLARVDRLHARGASTRIDADGTFGLVAGRVGELRYSVAIDSLGAYNRWIPGGEARGQVRPRSALVARAIQRAREDSTRVAKATEVERAATGRPMPEVKVDMPRTLAAEALSGRVYAGGTLRGNVKDFDVRGRLSAEDVVARGNSADVLRAEYAWTNARTKASRIAVGLEGRAITVKGFAFDTLEGRLAYKNPTGEVQLAVRQGDERDYSVAGSFVVGSKRSITVQTLAMRMDTTIWRLAHAATVHMHPGGVELHEVELRSNKGGLLYVNGLLPTEGNANVVLDVRNFQVADVSSFLQSDFPLRGILTARGRLSGTMRNPTFQGAAGLLQGDYNGSAIPDFQATLSYANSSLRTHAEALRSGQTPSVVLEGTIPINLAFSTDGPRLLDREMRVDISGDSLPLDLVPAFTDVVAQVRGQAVGSFTMRGTLKRPTFAGAVAWRNGSFRIVPTGALVENVAASVRMARDTVWVDSVAGRSGRGPLRMTGRLYVGNWREPEFDLHLAGTGAEVMNSDRGRLDADLGVSLTGPFKNAYLAGAVRIRQGVAYVPETSKKQLVNPGDPALFAVMDTSVKNNSELFPLSNPMLENLRVDVDVAVNRNTWVRSRDANIEVYTEEPVRVHREADALALTGVVSTDRGEYTFLSKRFEVKRGSATFTGGADLNPALQATGEYEVAIAGRPNFDIRVVIGGTLQRPKLTLESDAQPPISQSDLLSYLAFGRSTTSLLSLEGSGLTGATATGSLIGVGAALAMKRMTAVALGLMMDEIEGEATRGLGADVFNIEPADVPTELGAQQTIDFLTSTRIEAGKYLSPYFFAALQLQKYPGLRAAYRGSRGMRYEFAVEPRYLLQPPSFALQRISPTTSFGAFLIREWRF